ncbi:glycosyltransferase [Nocardioides sp. NPDC006273]|uniref:glycosyltransferase n=1 Tax=Nocardioides sp. NPDC006273 TaxID=3155598 RepID=UPI0033A97737
MTNQPIARHTPIAPAEETVLASAAEVGAFVAGLSRPGGFVKIVVEDVDQIRALTVADPSITVSRLSLKVRRWEWPHRRWNGRLGWLPGVLRQMVRYPARSVGASWCDIELRDETSLALVARAVYPLFAVDRGHHGFGHVQLGTDAVDAAALALLPTRTAPGIPELPVDQLQGVGLSSADLGLVSSPERFDELVEVAEDPRETVFRTPVLVDAHGHLSISERSRRPVVDLHVHNPIGRLQGFDEPEGWLALTIEGDQLHLRPTAGSAEELDEMAHPLAAPFTRQEIARLRHVESVDLSGLAAVPEECERTLHRRLAEIAASGAIMHSMSAGLELANETLGETLADLLRKPYQPVLGLVRELRSVGQRREAMERFGGFFELAGFADDQGRRLLPKVSAVLSTMRPDRVSAVVEALAAQRYPHLEIIVAVHGAEAPLPGELEDAIKAADATVLLHDRATPFGAVLADAARHASGDLIVKIDDDDVYGPQVIGDLVLAYLYSSADMVGKTTEYLYLEALGHTVHRTFTTEAYHYQLAGGAMMLSTAMLNEVGGWRPTPNSTDRSVLIRVGNAGGIGYRTTSLGYVYIRHADGHTWKRDESSLVAGAFEQWPRFMPEIVDG